ncbi:hypothetical protein NF867_14880 [Solitalea sp. MAHUQ-68]|uniref:Adenylosuccinate lyase n=1 Tax=Solitalea agri TaxID=2953739 RepID=A0A9X2JG74_9SPHI|nr:hypothetical protein [Solitalea agri]MCO4294146.1 hypothetical protein [Solitalea agri]
MEELTKRISKTLTKKEVLKITSELIKNNVSVNDLINLTFSNDKETGFRASWILEQIAFSHQSMFLPSLPYFFSRFKEVQNESCKRHYAKIAQEYTRHLSGNKYDQRIRTMLEAMDFEHIIETLFEWLINNKTRTAVIAFSMEALYNLSSRYDWIKEELSSQIIFLMKNGSAGIHSRGKKLLNKLL